jgi:hypothetical protein
VINSDAFDQNRDDLARQLGLLGDDEPYEKTDAPAEDDVSDEGGADR